MIVTAVGGLDGFINATSHHINRTDIECKNLDKARFVCGHAVRQSIDAPPYGDV